MGQDLSVEREILQQISKIPTDHKGIDDFVQRTEWVTLYQKMNGFLIGTQEGSEVVSSKTQVQHMPALPRDLERLLNVKLVQVSATLLERLTLLATHHKHQHKRVAEATDAGQGAETSVGAEDSQQLRDPSPPVYRCALLLRALAVLLSAPNLSKEFSRLSLTPCMFYFDHPDALLQILSIQVLRSALVNERVQQETRRAGRQHAANSGAFHALLTGIRNAQISAEEIGLPEPEPDPHCRIQRRSLLLRANSSQRLCSPRDTSAQMMWDHTDKMQQSSLPQLYTVWMGLDLLNTMLDYDEGTTDSETLKMVQGLVCDQRELIFKMCRHCVLTIRAVAWRLLWHLLLHVDISLATGLQESSVTNGTLLWMFYVSVSKPLVGCISQNSPALKPEFIDTPGGHLQVALPPAPSKDKLVPLARDLVEMLTVGCGTAMNLFSRALPYWILDNRHSLYLDRLERFWPGYNQFKAAGNESNFLLNLFGINQQKKEIPARTFWFTPFGLAAKGQNWDAVLQAIEKDEKSPDRMWDETCRQELRVALRRSIDHFNYLRASQGIRMRATSAELKWQIQGFEVDYPSHRLRLMVGGYFLHELLPAMELRGFEVEDPSALLWQIYDRLIVEGNGRWRLDCLRTMRFLLLMHGSSLSHHLPVRFLTTLLREEPPKESFVNLNDSAAKITPQQWYREIMLVLNAALEHEESQPQDRGVVREFVKVGGLDCLLPFFCHPLMMFEAEQKTLSHPRSQENSQSKNKNMAQLSDVLDSSEPPTKSQRKGSYDVFVDASTPTKPSRSSPRAASSRTPNVPQAIPASAGKSFRKEKLRMNIKLSELYSSAHLAVSLAKLCLERTAIAAQSLGRPECMSAMLGGLMVLGGHYGRQRNVDLPALTQLLKLLHSTLQILPLSYPDLHNTGLFHFVLLAVIGSDGSGRMTPEAVQLLRLASHIEVEDADRIYANKDQAAEETEEITESPSLIARKEGMKKKSIQEFEDPSNNLKADTEDSAMPVSEYEYLYLGYFFPLQLVRMLATLTDLEFVNVFNQDTLSPELIWNRQLRLDLLTSVRRATCQFERALEASPSTAQFQYPDSSLLQVVYPSLAAYPQVGGVFLLPLLKCENPENLQCLDQNGIPLFICLLEEVGSIAAAWQSNPFSQSLHYYDNDQGYGQQQVEDQGALEAWLNRSTGFGTTEPMTRLPLLLRAATYLAERVPELGLKCKRKHFDLVWKAMQKCLETAKNTDPDVRSKMNISIGLGFFLCTLLVQTEGKYHSPKPKLGHQHSSKHSPVPKLRHQHSRQPSQKIPKLQHQYSRTPKSSPIPNTTRKDFKRGQTVVDETISKECRRIWFLQEGGLDIIFLTVKNVIGRVHKCVELLYQDESRITQMIADSRGFSIAVAEALGSIQGEIMVAVSLLIFLAPLCYECGAGVFPTLRENHRLLGLIGRFCQEDYAAFLPRISLLAMNCLSRLCQDPSLQVEVVNAGIFVALLQTAMNCRVLTGNGNPGALDGSCISNRRYGRKSSVSIIQTERDVLTKLWSDSRQTLIGYLKDNADHVCLPSETYMQEHFPGEVFKMEDSEDEDDKDEEKPVEKEIPLQQPVLAFLTEISQNLVLSRCTALLQQLAQNTAQGKDSLQTEMLKQHTLVFRQLLTPGLHRQLLLDPAGFLETLRPPKMTRTPTLIWNDETRDVLARVLKEERHKIKAAESVGMWPVWNAQDLVAAEGHRYQYPSLSQQVEVADIYLNVLLEAPLSLDYSPNTASSFMDALLLSISSSHQAVVQAEGRASYGNSSNNKDILQMNLNVKMEVLKRMLQQHPELQYKCQSKIAVPLNNI